MSYSLPYCLSVQKTGSNLASRTIVKLWFTHTVVYTLETLRKKKKKRKTSYNIGNNFQGVFLREKKNKDNQQSV